ncbi:Amino acid transporter [Sulfobacillus thermosulfidooxidans DSM 9293]|uniref:Amino acid transporter n=1 Tax=Sulfobacillus thermosulfidooxidans (strain DSM 9293 / VKM B-1269 / AT-1) TaxID=929705 RepID=A0A1W1WFP6_SULTA|nr:APC family permease [Sulfobacillus thermosulfidooxidans]SMC05022.1 Amino acid transporter [Sulfobacillus thermosulfidooxidans DSM 9293]
MAETLASDLQRHQSPNEGLAKDLTWLSVIGLGVSSEVGAGVFYLTAQVQGVVPGIGPHVPLVLIVDAILAAVLAVTYWFFSHSIAGAGGEYLFVSRSLGPQVGFVIHVVSWFGATASIGFLAYTAPSFIAQALMLVQKGAGLWMSSTIGTLVTGLFLIWLAWGIHVRGIKHVGTLVKIAMVVIFLAALSVIIIGFTHNGTELAQKLATHDQLSASYLSAHATAHPSWLAFFEALPVLYFAYAGLRSATYAGGETPNAKMVVGRSILIVLALVAVLYVSFALALYHMAPWPVVAGLISTGHKSLANATALAGLFLPNWLAVTLSFGVAFIVFKTMLPGMMGQSRMLLAFAKDGWVPKPLAQLSPRKTPVTALTVGALLSSLILIQTALTGTAFGLASSVLAGAIVHAALGLGLIFMPTLAPALFAANKSWLVHYAGLRILLGSLMVLIGGGLGILVVIPEIKNPWYFNPLFQVLLFAGIGVVLFRHYAKREVPSTSS